MNLHDLRLRARALFRPRRVERELDDELAFHLECEARKLIEQGVARAEAVRQARARFGPVPLAADQCRDARGTAFVDKTARQRQRERQRAEHHRHHERVLSYMVEQRRQEIGVRMALGATTRQIGRLVLSQSMRPVVVGLIVGGVLAVSLGRVLLVAPIGGELGAVVRVVDPAAYGASVLVIAAACLLAALLPALRAARIDPIATLRDE